MFVFFFRNYMLYKISGEWMITQDIKKTELELES